MSSSSSRKRMAASVANVMFKNGVYFPNYAVYGGATPGMLNYSCISHVYYAFASVAADGSVFVCLTPTISGHLLEGRLLMLMPKTPS